MHHRHMPSSLDARRPGNDDVPLRRLPRAVIRNRPSGDDVSALIPPSRGRSESVSTGGFDHSPVVPWDSNNPWGR